MIGKLTGRVDTLGLDSAIIDVGGVGYIVACATPTLSRLTQGGPASLLIETRIRDEIMALYGFADAHERDWFRLLTTVQGVGAKVALAILAAVPPDRLVLAIASGDKVALTRADGVGPKLALRIVTELKDKAGTIGAGDVSSFAPAEGAGKAAGAGGPANSAAQDAVSALVNLGYQRVDAFGAVAAAVKQLGKEAALSDLIRLGLKELSS
jgi:Holliday junction DNA helicase RuvA